MFYWPLPPDPNDLVLGQMGHFPFAPRVKLSAEERARHLYIIGATGRGKSKLLESLLLQDITRGRGFALVDPHSRLADDLLRSLLRQGISSQAGWSNRLIYLDPARTDTIVPFNILANASALPYDIAAAVLEAFRRTWPDSLKEAPHFTNVLLASLLVLIANHLTLMHLPRLLTEKTFRERCLAQVTDPQVVELFHSRVNRFEDRFPLRNESILNKVSAFALNPRLRLMLGQPENHLDFRQIMDEGKILLLDLGHADPETRRLIGSLVVTGIELAMRSRHKRDLWSLVIDEFADYVATEGSLETLAQVFAAGRKYGVSLTIAHQDLSQLSPRILGALSNVQTKVIFGVGRPEAAYFARLIGQVNPEAIKREPLTDTQQAMFSPLSEQWEQWAHHLQYQKDRWATVATREGRAIQMRTIDLPQTNATDQQVEAVRRESLQRFGLACRDAERNLEAVRSSAQKQPFPGTPIRSDEAIDSIDNRNEPKRG